MINRIEIEEPWHLTVLDETDSTNNALKRLAAEGAPHGTALLALRQTGGRGRMGRQFSSPEGGVYLSVLLRPHAEAEKLLHLTAAAAVAVRRAISDCCGVEVGIKWTNDLVYGNKKLCGILTELSSAAEDGTVCYAIIGIGINANTVSDAFPEAVRQIAVSLREITGHCVERTALASAVLRRLREMDAVLLQERQSILDEYAGACVTVGKPVQVICGGQRRAAVAEGIDAYGGLLVRYDDGSVAAIHSGEVSVRGMYGYL